MKSIAAKRTLKLLDRMRYAVEAIEMEAIPLESTKENQRRMAQLLELTLIDLHKQLGTQLLGYRARAKGITV